METKTLAQLRRERHMSQKVFGETIGLSGSSIAMYEIGARTPTLNTAKKIARFFAVPVESIVFCSQPCKGVGKGDYMMGGPKS